MQLIGGPRYDRSWVMKLAHAKRRAAKGTKPFRLCLKQAWEAAKAIADIAAMRRPRERTELFPVPFALAFPFLASEQQRRGDALKMGVS
jgi:hypothetical protein